uniref:Aminotransferase n=1 Tax=uncultured bacterium fosmid pJB77G10 TaxID=1478069 RepID=A0A0H3U7T4_9BACT|nr:putative aminotransferase class I/II [uncultured bacterium fosmid pJB77G10]
MEVSKRVAGMQFSPIRRFNQFAFEAEAQGKTVYRLNIGQPDVETPPCFKEAIDKFDNKIIAYAESQGLNDLRDAMVEYMARDFDMHYDRDDIIITNGGSEALILAFTALLNEGDEALIAEPFYTNYNTFCNEVSGVLVPLTTSAEDGYDWAKRDLIEAAITPKTKAICCLSPGNPTGRVLTLEDMKLIGEIAKEHDLWIISDEVYREFVYDGAEAHSFGQIEDIADRVIIVDSVSKRWSACGARIGALVSKNKEFMSAILKLCQGRLCVPTLEQVGAAALYRMDKSYYDAAKAEYEGRRDAAYEELSKIPGIVCQKPAGAFYMTAKLPVDSIEDFLMFMLKEFDENGETAMFAPAPGFYATKGLGGNEMRIAYVLTADKMRRACELIAKAVEAYNNK